MNGWGDRCFDDVWKLERPVNNAIKLEKTWFWISWNNILIHKIISQSEAGTILLGREGVNIKE